MPKQTINRGTAANDGTGDNLRAGAAKINENFDELYTVLGDGTTLLSGDYITTQSTSILTNKSIENILDAKTIATEKAFTKKNIPFRTFYFSKKNEQELGAIFTFFVLETILLSRLMKVNPFNQPSVEIIKNETKKILLRN